MTSPKNLPNDQQNHGSSSVEAIDNLIELLLDGSSDLESATKTSEVSDTPSDKAVESKSSPLDAESDELDADYTPVNNQTLDEAVEYRQFLQQQSTTAETKKLEDSQAASSTALLANFNNDKLADKLADTDLNLDHSVKSEAASTRELADSINTLIPLMVELVKYKIDESQESIVKSVTPVVDRIIEQRALEDSPKMAAAIAKILPQAITSGIDLTPEAIAKAIAPELALCITEQIRLDENAISEALGSEMGKAIKTQIELEKDAMVDALYPVIGSTIAKYMVEVVQDINRKVDNTLSREGLRRKIQAKVQGVSEAELIFRESIGYYVQAAFLIDKDSGIVIQEVKQEEDANLDSGMIAGMLTAIRSFANDCIAAGSELDEIDYGDFQIPIEVAGYCYLAVVVKGEPSREFRTKIRNILGEIVLNYGQAIADFEGDISTIPSQVQLRLGELLNQDQPQKPTYRSILPLLLVFVVGAVLIPWGIISYRQHTAYNIEQAVAVELDAAPELSIYRLEPYVERGTLTITGKVPSSYLQNRAKQVSQKVAAKYNLQLDNQIVAVKTPANPSSVRNEIQKLTRLLNRQADTQIATNYDFATKTLQVSGFAIKPSAAASLEQVLKQVPGVSKIVLNLKTQLPSLTEKIYFNSGGTQLDFQDSSSKIESIVQFLQRYPQLNLRLTAHSDSTGSFKFNQTLSKQRCQAVKAAVESKGVAAKRLTAQCDRPINSDNDNQPSWLLRYVSFEPYISTNSLNDK